MIDISSLAIAMLTSAMLARAILATVSLGLVIWESLWPRSSKALVPSLAFAALALAFAASAHVAPGSPPDELAQVVVRALFLGVAGLSLLIDTVEPNVAGPHMGEGYAGHRVLYALRLLAVCGGILAISSADLLTLWVGLQLYVLAGFLAHPSARRKGDVVERSGATRMLAMAVLLFGLALVYTSAGTLDITTLNRSLWEQGGPRSAMLFAGLGLTIGGIAICTGLLPPYGEHSPEESLVSPILGVALLLRLVLFGLGAYSWECFWALISISLVALAWGGITALWSRDAPDRFWRLSILQRGFLLLALALSFREEGLEAFLMAILAYALAQAILQVSDRLRGASNSGDDELFAGWLRQTPWLGLPLLISLLSLAGIPATLGFTARAYTFWLAPRFDISWVASTGLVASILCAGSYLPTTLSLIRGRGSRPNKIRVPLPVALSMALAALGLVVLGVYPLPLRNLARWIIGG